MTFALTSFIVSFVLIAILTLHKVFEISRRETMFSRMRGKVDIMVDEHLSVVKGHSQVFEKGTVQTFFKIFFNSVKEAFMHVHEVLSLKWDDFFHSLKTASVKKTDAQVSLFLKDISRLKRTSEEARKM